MLNLVIMYIAFIDHGTAELINYNYVRITVSAMLCSNIIYGIIIATCAYNYFISISVYAVV